MSPATTMPKPAAAPPSRPRRLTELEVITCASLVNVWKSQATAGGEEDTAASTTDERLANHCPGANARPSAECRDHPTARSQAAIARPSIAGRSRDAREGSDLRDGRSCRCPCERYCPAMTFVHLGR